MDEAHDNQPIVFISYSNQDEKEKEALLTHLGGLQRAHLIRAWSDDLIGPGKNWEQAINEAIAQAKVAILLVTANFLSSEYIIEKQLPTLIAHHEIRDLIIFPVIAKACPWKNIGWLQKMNVRPQNGQPVWSDRGSHVDEDLATIAEEVVNVISNSTSEFSLVGYFPHPIPPGVQEHIRDYSHYIEERIQDFVGRQFVFEAVKRFMQANQRGYFFIRGDPGIGKTALAAQIVMQNKYIHHFNIKPQGINTISQFRKNICAQLIAKYRLNYSVLPQEAIDDANFLEILLNQVADKLEPDEQCVVVIDALDEVEEARPDGVNLLNLPLTIPRGVYIVLTMRNDERFKPRVDCEQGELLIDHNLQDNLTDVANFLQLAVAKQLKLQEFINSQGIETQVFIELMTHKSEGNFQYLRYVLPALEEGIYKDLKIEDLPIGLKGYYEDHWRRMGMTTKPAPRTKLLIIYIMAEVRRPTSRRRIAKYAKVDQLTVQEVFDEWSQFLHVRLVESEALYNFYHTSFLEFLHRKDIVKAAWEEMMQGKSLSDFLRGQGNVDSSEKERESLNAFMGDTLWEELFGDN